MFPFIMAWVMTLVRGVVLAKCGPQLDQGTEEERLPPQVMLGGRGLLTAAERCS